MVYVTEAARRYLRVLRAAAQLTRPGTMPRIAARAPGQLGLFRGVHSSQDTVIYHKGAPLLLLQPDIAAKLERTVIHCRHERGGPQLVITLLRGGRSRDAAPFFERSRGSARSSTRLPPARSRAGNA